MTPGKLLNLHISSFFKRVNDIAFLIGMWKGLNKHLSQCLEHIKHLRIVKDDDGGGGGDGDVGDEEDDEHDDYDDKDHDAQ